MAICVISFLVCMHHFWHLGDKRRTSMASSVHDMIIAVTTGGKYFNWLFTCMAAVRFSVPHPVSTDVMVPSSSEA